MIDVIKSTPEPSARVVHGGVAVSYPTPPQTSMEESWPEAARQEVADLRIKLANMSQIAENRDRIIFEQSVEMQRDVNTCREFERRSKEAEGKLSDVASGGELVENLQAMLDALEAEVEKQIEARRAAAEKLRAADDKAGVIRKFLLAKSDLLEALA